MTEQFKTWALVELFGHTRIAGLAQEMNVAGGAMVRIDIPETKNNPAFTRIVNVSAIYAINPMSEESARMIAQDINYKPVDMWDIQSYVKQAQLKLQESVKLTEETSENDDDINF